ncbi:MAG: hypothetical protein D6717_05425 [Gammaproteobacteria bacterium]|nr:MAG: hypothetical protein D6717_05425 [Gammaproteobacteria bacterium]
MKDGKDGFDDIPTLTEVVRPGNPNLVFHLDLPPEEEETEASGPDTDTAGTGEAEGPADPAIELGLPEDFFTTPATEAEGLGTLDLFADAEEDHATDDGNPPSAPMEAHRTEAAALAAPTEPEPTAASPLDPDALLIRLEVPIAEILQRHWEQAREEILALIREELQREAGDSTPPGE